MRSRDLDNHDAKHKIEATFQGSVEQISSALKCSSAVGQKHDLTTRGISPRPESPLCVGSRFIRSAPVMKSPFEDLTRDTQDHESPAKGEDS